MPLTKSVGNMYPWVTHMISHLRGECPHRCLYCYVKSTTAGRMGLYDGPLSLSENALKANHMTPSVMREAKEKGLDFPVIFIDHMNDLWAKPVPRDWIERVLFHCGLYSECTYVFQTKNPERYNEFLPLLPPNRILGCTIETDDLALSGRVSKAPPPEDRMRSMAGLHRMGERTFVTIEPILKCYPYKLAMMMHVCEPDFVNIGADSKGTGLDEPSGADVIELIAELNRLGIEIRAKHNLDRLMQKGK